MTNRAYLDNIDARRPWFERTLLAVGVQPAFLDATLGDIAEERSGRADTQGSLAAHAWGVMELVRLAPYFLRNAIRYGSPAARARLVALVGAIAIMSILPGLVHAIQDGPPTRLVAEATQGAGGIVINNLGAVQLEVRAYDDRNHRLRADSARYAFIGGAPLRVTPRGAVTCTQRGESHVLATLGNASVSMNVLCRPIKEVRASSWMDFIVGDNPRPIEYVALGTDGREVTELRGSSLVRDTSVAVMRGASVAPRAAGRTWVLLSVGDRGAAIGVNVHELVPSFDALKPAQRYVAIATHVAHGDTIRIALPRQAFWLKYLPVHEGDAPPTIAVGGVITCTGSDGLRSYRLSKFVFATYCLSQDGWVEVAHGLRGAPVVNGYVALEIMEQ